MSRKRNSEYQALGAFYSEEKASASSPLVQNKGHANTIRNWFQSATSQFRDIHNLFNLKTLRKMAGFGDRRGPNSGNDV